MRCSLHNSRIKALILIINVLFSVYMLVSVPLGYKNKIHSNYTNSITFRLIRVIHLDPASSNVIGYLT